MIVSVKGSTKYNRHYVEEAAHFYHQLLMPRMRTLQIDIELVANLETKDGVSGDCTWEDSRGNPREFTIRVCSTVGRSEMLMTLAHEMVHVKQYARGELKDTYEGFRFCKWMGKRYNWNKTHYYDLPWEIEAHGREEGMFVRYAKKYDYEMTKWYNL